MQQKAPRAVASVRSTPAPPHGNPAFSQVGDGQGAATRGQCPGSPCLHVPWPPLGSLDEMADVKASEVVVAPLKGAAA